MFPLLLITFLILAAAALLQTGLNPPAATPTPATEQTELPLMGGSLLRVFPDLAVLDIQAIRIENPAEGESFTISRDESGNWTAPDVEGQLDTNAASDIARTLVLLPYGRSINITASTDLSEYGFLPTPQFLISLVLANGAGHAIAIGELSESEPIYYALIDERDEILEVERGAVDFLVNFVDSPPVNLTN